MITFKKFLREMDDLPVNVQRSWETKALTLERAADMAFSKCSHAISALDNRHGLWRSFKELGNQEATYIDSSASKRASRDSNNLYQLALNASMHKSHIPSRSNSIICSTSISIAYSYNDQLNLILPFDGTPIAFSDGDDFIYTNINSKFFNGEMHLLGTFLESVFSFLGLEHQDRYEDVEEIDQFLSTIDPVKFALAVTTISRKIGSKTIHALFNFSNAPDDFMDVRDMEKRFSHVRTSAPDLLDTLVKGIKSGEVHFDDVDAEEIYDAARGWDKNKRFTELSTAILDKASNHIDVKTNAVVWDNSVECWFSGKCIAIRAWGEGSQLLPFAEMLKKEGYEDAADYLTLMQRHGK